MNRVKHIAYVVNDLEESAAFFEDVLDFRRYSRSRRAGNFPAYATDLTDGELNVTLLKPDENIPRQAWAYGTAGPNHIGLETDRIEDIRQRLIDRGVAIYAEEHGPELRYFKFRDPNGVEFDVSAPERGWRIPTA
jgi:catechol 2,3-dioxygenase-like lactoylglutathione lyase family enzyme